MNLIVEKTDTELKMNLLDELRFEPTVHIADIGILVQDGVVTLHGIAGSYSEKLNAVRAAKRVAGVSAVVDEIDIHMRNSGCHSDGDIATEAVNRLNWSTLVPPGAVQLTVRAGHITLEGALEWGYQKHAAEAALHHMTGVCSITNAITISPTTAAMDIGSDIRSAIRRNAMLEAKEIRVEVAGSEVVLTGKVRSYADWEEAERLAWSAKGVLSVDNRLKVEWFWGLVD
jgi:osmotically-inducible protein OsmY